MTSETSSELYLAWADPASPWSRWVKPVLFAYMGRVADSASRPEPTADLRWLPPRDPPVALVVDLPGAAGVVLGVALAGRGYRPVPLYNALPCAPEGDDTARTAVDVAPIVAHLRAATRTLRTLRLPDDAPPAFLLDANRRTAAFTLAVGDFDNRSVCFATDFPSAELLRASGIHRALVIEQGSTPDADLARVLAEWEAGGVALWRKDLARSTGPEPLPIPRPRWWQRVWYALTVTLGLRRAPLGGFGSTVEPTGG